MSEQVMNLHAAGAFSIIFFNAVLWYFILSNRKRDQIVNSYLKWSASVALWSLGYGITLLGKFSYDTTLLWNRSCHIFASFIPVFFLELVYSLIEKPTKHARAMKLVYACGCLLSILAFTPYLVRDLWQMGQFRYQPLGNTAGYLLFTAFFWVVVSYGLILLYRQSSQFRGSKREQMRIFMAGSAIGYTGGSTLFLQPFGLSVAPTGVFFISSYVLYTGYSIYRYGFMNLELIIKRTTVFAGLFVFVFGVFSSITILSQELIVRLFGWSSQAASIPALMVIIITFDPARKYLVSLTDKYLFQKNIDYTQLILRFNKDIRKVFEIRDIIRASEDMISATIEPETLLIYLLDKRSDQYEGAGKMRGKPLAGSSNIVKQTKLKKPIYLYDPGISNALASDMQSMKIELVLPMLGLEDEFLGMILMGKKKSDKDYSPEEIEVFDSLATSVATSLATAKKATEYSEALARVRLAFIASGMSHQFKNKFGAIQTQLNARRIFITRLVASENNQQNPTTMDELNQLLNKYKSQLHDTLKVIDEQIQNCLTGRDVANTITAMANPDRHKDFLLEDISLMLPISMQIASMAHDKDLDYNKVKITHEKIGDIPKSACIKVALVETFTNAIDNAYEAIKLFKNRPLTEGKIHLTIEHMGESDTIRVIIKDNGLGIKKEHLHAIGTPGFTTKGTAKDKKSGFGMGVHMMREFIAMHDGTLKFESEFEKGTACVINLPVHVREIKSDNPQNEVKS